MARELLPEGDYLGVIRSGWDVTRSFNGKYQFTIPVKLTSFINEDSGEQQTLNPPANRDINLSLSPANIESTIRSLRFLGYDRKDVSGLNPRDENAFDFKGKPIGGKIQHGEWKGKDTETVWFSTKGLEQSQASREAILGGVAELFEHAANKVAGVGGDEPDDENDAGDDDAPF